MAWYACDIGLVKTIPNDVTETKRFLSEAQEQLVFENNEQLFPTWLDCIPGLMYEMSVKTYDEAHVQAAAPIYDSWQAVDR